MIQPADPANPTTRPEIANTRRLELMESVGGAIASSSDLTNIVQIVTDVATELTGAEFGSFFYNVLDDKGESYLLYTLSGVPRSAFEKFGMPRNTAVFDHTFRGLGIVRSADIKTDPRYGLSSPHFGMPKGHLPVTSYLAVPVMSRTGETLGGLFFGHSQVGVFTEADEKTVSEIAARASTAIDNSRLLDTAQRFASIVESSDDAIISKDLTGTVRSWNRGAERIFGYTAKEMIGRPITMLIPEHLHHEEPEILARITAGERIDHFETIRQRKDGTLFHISVTVSPVRDRTGKIIGASKIARDIDASKKAQEAQSLLLREMNHRVKNLFAVASGVVAISARSAQAAPDLAKSIQSRLGALARANDLTLMQDGQKAAPVAELKALLHTILSPYETTEQRIALSGPMVECGGGISTSLALLFHEFATNSVKYGALSAVSGRVSVDWTKTDMLALTWTEVGGPVLAGPSERQGFGKTLIDLTARAIGGSVERMWRPEGLVIELKIPLSQLVG